MPRVSPEQSAEFARTVETGPDRKVDGVVRWRRNNAFEAARRLAFALAKAAQMDQSGQLLVGHVVGEER